MTTRLQLLLETMERLGDSTGELWSGDEVSGYIQTGYDELAMRTGCLWDTVNLPDYAYAFNYTSPFEYAFIANVSGWYANGPAQFTSSFERDLIDNARGPANHSNHWEFNLGYVSVTEVSALVDLPVDLHEIERATWNTKRTAAIRSRDLESDGRYELTKGPVDAYTQDKDGLRRLRKWKVPSTAYVPYEFDASSDDGFGIIRLFDGITMGTVDGNYGDLVQMPGIDTFADFGIMGPIYKETGNFRAQYRRRGATLAPDQPFEIQDRYTIYVRHYAMAECLERDGPGNDPDLAAHYRARYEAGIQRMLKRKDAIHFQKASVLGGSSTKRQMPRRVRLPWQYGTVER